MNINELRRELRINRKILTTLDEEIERLTKRMNETTRSDNIINDSERNIEIDQLLKLSTERREIWKFEGSILGQIDKLISN